MPRVDGGFRLTSSLSPQASRRELLPRPPVGKGRTPRASAAMYVIEVILFVLALLVVLQTGVTLVRTRVWWVRIFDFPRAQILAVSAFLLVATVLVHGGLKQFTDWEWALFLLLAASVTVQALQILPYTRLWRKTAASAPPDGPADRRLRLVVSNVLMTNRDFSRWLATVQAEDPDVIVAVEVDDWWDQQLLVLASDYPHHVRHPQDNSYGLALYSRCPLTNVKIRHLVEDDIPSVFAEVRLPSGDEHQIVVLHPRPPRPDVRQDSDLRDAELVRAARAMRSLDEPFIVAGDLNDVAWSHTTRMFQRIAGALDPRVGRGIFATYHADHWFARYPLDHVFYSPHFELVELRRLNHVGSDHFPIMVELSLKPRAQPPRQQVESPSAEDKAEAREAESEAEERLEEETPAEREERRALDR
jgi:endonuclease/exonuclease/phosphatase (EEP) superfamily protein YafD